MTNFDFNKLQRQYFNVRLKDGKELNLAMPTKKTFEKIDALSQPDREESYEMMLSLITEIFNNNKEGIEVSYEYVTEQDYSIEEMTLFIVAYTEFVQGLQENPNLRSLTTRTENREVRRMKSKPNRKRW